MPKTTPNIDSMPLMKSVLYSNNRGSKARGVMTGMKRASMAQTIRNNQRMIIVENFLTDIGNILMQLTAPIKGATTVAKISMSKDNTSLRK